MARTRPPVSELGTVTSYKVALPNGKEGAVVIRAGAHGYSAELFISKRKRLPLSAGRARNISEAVRNTKRFLEQHDVEPLD